MSQEDGERVALVTGGSRGIGRAVVEALLEEGWRVFLTAASEGSASRTAGELAERWGDRVAARAADARSEEAAHATVEWVLERAGRLDALVNNAGVGEFGAVDELSGESWRRVIEINLNGPFYYLNAATSALADDGGGWVLNIASLAARNPFAGGAAYNASKFGLLGLSDAAMLDLRHRGIRVTAILPGSVDTDFHGDRRDERGWMLAPEDVARTVVDLLRYPGRALPSRVELRPSRPPKK